jgi:hypothetical protein
MTGICGKRKKIQKRECFSMWKESIMRIECLLVVSCDQCYKRNHLGINPLFTHNIFNHFASILMSFSSISI